MTYLSKKLSTCVVAMSLAAAASLVSGAASAHTIKLGWEDVGGGNVQFWAGNYHTDIGPTGGMVIDGMTFNFDQTVSAATFNTTYAPNLDGMFASSSTLSLVHWQGIIVGGLSSGIHSLATTCTTFVECPWPSSFPTNQQIDVSAVSEPGTLALFGLGLAGLGYARRRKVA